MFLQERLEALSAYRPCYGYNDALAARNPISFAHTRLDAGGKCWHVLSRVGPAPLDYSGRSNKLAHHVVFEPEEMPRGGPAWALAQPGFMESAWDGEIGWIETGRSLPEGDLDAMACRSWEAVAGDAGWAGVLVEKTLEDSASLVCMVYEAGMDVLSLFVEAMALIPPERRGEVCFNTYAVSVPKGLRYQWHGILAGSPEAKALRSGATVIDLTAPARLDRESDWIEGARTGRTHGRPECMKGGSHDLSRNVGRLHPKQEPGAGEYKVRSRSRPGRVQEGENAIPSPPAIPQRPSPSRPILGRNKRWIAGLVAVCAAAAVVTTIVATGVFIVKGLSTRLHRNTANAGNEIVATREEVVPPSSGGSTQPSGQLSKSVVPGPIGPAQVSPGLEARSIPKPPPPSGDKSTIAVKKGTKSPDKPIDSKPGAGTLTMDAGGTKTSPPSPALAENVQPKNAIRAEDHAKDREFLPGLTLPREGSKDYPLAPLGIAIASKTTLSLIGPAEFTHPSGKIKLIVESKGSTLDISYKTPAEMESHHVAQMGLANGSLHFKWIELAKHWEDISGGIAALLRDSILEFSQPDGPRTYLALREPLHLKTIREENERAGYSNAVLRKSVFLIEDMGTQNPLLVHSAEIDWEGTSYTTLEPGSAPGSARLKANSNLRIILNLQVVAASRDKRPPGCSVIVWFPAKEKTTKAPDIVAFCLYTLINDHKVEVCRFHKETPSVK